MKLLQTTQIPLVRCGQFLQTLETLRSLGLEPDPLLRAAGIPKAWILAGADDFIPARPNYRLLHLASRATGIKPFGGLAAQQDFALLGSYARFIGGSRTVSEALVKMAVAASGFDGTHTLWLRPDSSREGIWVCRSGAMPFEGGVAQLELWAIRLMIGVVRLGAGPTWKPSRICFRSGPEILDDLDRIEALRGVSASADQPWGGICVPRSALELPLAGEQNLPAGDGMAHWWDASCTRGFGNSLRRLLASTCTITQDPSIGSVAKLIDLHPRALQRRLAREGLTYRAVVDRARFQWARQMMMRGRESLLTTDIALNVGYSELAHFTRAFRRWSGVAPSEYRRTLRS
jgi:AraC-like DNA-binding protein